MKILHIINSLDKGGAENILTQICINDKKNIHEVIALKKLGINAKILKKHNIITHSLNLTINPLSIIKLINLHKYIKSYSPDLVQTWLYHSDLIGGLFAKIAGVKKIYWNIRHTDTSSNKSKFITKLVIKISSRLSNSIPDKIIFCSEESMMNHQRIGYNKNKFSLIYNGVNMKDFDIKPGKNRIKKFLDISNDYIVFGMISRFHPLKDHETLLKALSIIKKNGVNFKCILLGNKIDMSNKILEKLILENNLKGSIKLLGQRNNVSRIMNLVDIGVLSTFSESFPNVLAEFMSCKVPCISSDQGAAKLIIGSTGWIVKSGDVSEMVNCINQAINEFQKKECWELRRNNARDRINKFFNIELMLKEYNNRWRNNIVQNNHL